MMKRQFTIPLIALTILVSGFAICQPLDSLVRHAVSFSAMQLRNSVASLGESVLIPRSTLENGKWKTVRPNDWTSGFFSGSLWYGYELTGDIALKNAAEKWTGALEDQKSNTKTHDVGFIMYCSFGNGIRLFPNDAYKQTLLRAAQSLATRFNPTVGCIRSWDNPKWQYPVIIDNMMNLELLFWAAKNGGGKQCYDIAVTHARTTLKNHFRPDGSTYHVVSYDTANGSVLAKETHQGFAHESVWARGQAWAIYGFTMAYRETKEKHFLRKAEQSANWFVRHLPEDKIPYWDFNAPMIPNEPRDASAAAITASALFELSGFTTSKALRVEYRKVAKEILTSLCKQPYLAEGSTSMGIINHATGNWPAKGEIDVSLIYGDYYFLEALLRYQKLNSKQNKSNK
jgi:unsaturated chondroitin disaccharide hydrolase